MTEYRAGDVITVCMAVKIEYSMDYGYIVSAHGVSNIPVLASQVQAGETKAMSEQKPLDRVYRYMEALGSSLNLADPDGTLSSKKDVDETTQKIWRGVREDYRNLLEAVHELRDQE